MSGERVIEIRAIGDVPYSVISHLAESLNEIFATDVRIGNAVPIPPGSYDPARRQYLSGAFLEGLASAFPGSDGKVLGVTRVDLYTPGLNFVFGQAQLNGRFAVISTARLDPAFWGEGPDSALFRRRVLKEAVHELGHTYGLEHCPDPKCVMHFSNSIADTDLKDTSFCERCARRIGLKDRRL